MSKQLSKLLNPLAAAVVAMILGVSMDTWGRAGTASKSGGNGGWIFALILAPPLIAYWWWMNQKLIRKSKQITEALQKVSLENPEWEANRLKNFARDRFLMLQAAWGSQDLSLIKSHLHANLFPEWQSRIQEMIKKNERNLVVELKVLDVVLVDVKFYGDARDEFTVCIDARAKDQMIRKGEVLSEDFSQFREFWTFSRSLAQRWVLRDVSQSDAWKKFVNSAPICEPISVRKAA